ncbi:Gp49 family protein [Psychrobacter sp. ASPA161_6]|uniref:Gp49 family protein n=1 Tax=Psychrobacter sp. ASPA161_6 TaxID=3160962 RepID=UPI003F81734B
MTDLPNTVTKEQLDDLVARSKVEYAVFDNKLTVAVITLPNKFKVTGEASCVDAKNFKKELGETYALENAIKKLWELEGYLLDAHLHGRTEWLENQAGDLPVKCTAPQDPDQELTEDEVATLASGGSLCDCCEVVSPDDEYFDSVSWSYEKAGEDIDEPHPIKEGDHVDFGTSLHLMELGERMQREGWNGKGMFIYIVPAASYPAQRNAKGVLVGDYPNDMVPYSAYIALKSASGEVVPWTISQSDALATDWMLAS